MKENDLAHGEYIEWLGTVGFDRTTAHRFVKVYEEFGSNVDTWQHIGFRALYEIATLPPDQREKPHVVPSTVDEKYRDWERWTSEEVQMSRTQANRSMKVADELDGKMTTSSH